MFIKLYNYLPLFIKLYNYLPLFSKLYQHLPLFSKDLMFNTLRPRQDGRHFPDDILRWTFLNENSWILINISFKFVPLVPVNNIPAWVQIMAWRRPGDKPLSEPMMVSLLTHICVTRPQWVKTKIHVYWPLYIKWFIQGTKHCQENQELKTLVV